MIFKCEQCSKEIWDNENGSFQGCPHYSVTLLMIRNHRDNWNRVEEVDGELRYLGARHIIHKNEKRMAGVDYIFIQPARGNYGYTKPTMRDLFDAAYKTRFKYQP
jgi:hypothetical protein